MARQNGEISNIPALRKQLISWYDENQRKLPWRAGKDPYAIWVSEIMLQQTRVAVVVDRYQEFMRRFPTLPSLAQSDEQEVLALWSGLGYYRRARMLHKAAQFVTVNMDGVLPSTSTELRKLPGIGSYTAAAIASIAHGEPVAVVDGNVERVLLDRHPRAVAGRQRYLHRADVHRLASAAPQKSLRGRFGVVAAVRRPAAGVGRWRVLG